MKYFLLKYNVIIPAFLIALYSNHALSTEISTTSQIILSKNLLQKNLWEHQKTQKNKNIVRSEFTSYDGIKITLTDYGSDIDFDLLIAKISDSEERLNIEPVHFDSFFTADLNISRIDFYDELSNSIYINYVVEDVKKKTVHHLLIKSTQEQYTPKGYDDLLLSFYDFGWSKSVEEVLELPEDFEFKEDFEAENDSEYQDKYYEHVTQLRSNSIGLLTNVIDVDWEPLYLTPIQINQFNLLSDGHFRGSSLPHQFYHNKLHAHLAVVYKSSQISCMLKSLPYDSKEAIEGGWRLVEDAYLSPHHLHDEKWKARYTILENEGNKKYISEICSYEQNGGTAYTELTVPKEYEFFMSNDLYKGFLNGIQFKYAKP